MQRECPDQRPVGCMKHPESNAECQRSMHRDRVGKSICAPEGWLDHRLVEKLTAHAALGKYQDRFQFVVRGGGNSPVIDWWSTGWGSVKA